jgi:hypothetical protein
LDLLKVGIAVPTQPSEEEEKKRIYEKKLRTMSTTELIQELGTLKWHYALFKDQRKFERICAVELELAKRKGSLAPSMNSGVVR